MKFKFSMIKNSFNNMLDVFQENWKTFLLYTVVLLFLFVVVCVGVFFALVKGSEEVMVPNVIGKELTEALVQMQGKELYPKLVLRYSDNPQDKGQILDQNPVGGTIVKAGRRINITVSQGVVLDHVENYIGQTLEQVKTHFSTIFTATAKALIVLEDPLYKFDSSPAGTILEQNPPPDTPISDTVKLKLVVSRGPESEKVVIPELIDLSINDVLLQIARTPIVFDFTTRVVSGKEQAGTIVSQLPEAKTTINKYGRATAVFAFPAVQNDSLKMGVFSTALAEFPYPLQVAVEVVEPDGKKYTLVSLYHPGGNFSIPYKLDSGSTLIVYAAGEEQVRFVVP